MYTHIHVSTYILAKQIARTTNERQLIYICIYTIYNIYIYILNIKYDLKVQSSTAVRIVK